MNRYFVVASIQATINLPFSNLDRQRSVMSFFAEASIFGIGLILCGLFAWYIAPKKTELHKKIPRERIVGTIIGVSALWWSSRLVEPLLEGPLMQYRSLLIPIVIGVSIGSYFYLQYLFTRAFYGFILLTVTHIMHSAYTVNIGYRVVFSLICYAIGIVSMYFIANPYRFRDLLEKLSKDKRCRTITASICASMGLISLIFGFASR